MPSWLLKSAAQRLISALPASSRWNEVFQKHVTGSLELTPDRFEMRLAYAAKHYEYFAALRLDRSKGFNVLELGTGWYPVVPLGLYLCGAEEIWTYDIAALINRERLTMVVERMLQYEGSDKLRQFLPHASSERIRALQKAAQQGSKANSLDLLESLRIHVRVQDAQQTGLPNGTIDLFTSTGVLEYIPRPVLRNILSECRRVGRAHSIQSHYLNLADQYSYFDKSITPFNFLRYNPAAWKWLNSPLTWQNRLRISDYRQLFQEAGYRFLKEENRSGTLEELARVPLAPEFSSYTKADLLVLFSWVVAEAVSEKS